MLSERLTRRRFLKFASSSLPISGIGLGVALETTFSSGASIIAASQTKLYESLFILDTWFWTNGTSIDEQNKILREIGCPRTSECRTKWDTLPATLKKLDRDGINLVAVYAPIDIDSGRLPPQIETAVKVLKDTNVILWMALTSRKYKPSDVAGDGLAVPVLQRTADLAEKSELELSIYPHSFFWLERNSDALRLIRKVDRKNIGCTFNLYHWLKVQGPNGLQAEAKMVLPHLNCLTINGSRTNASELPVEKGILPLGEGDYDIEEFVRTFVRLGYKGPIGLQGYGIGGDVRGKLEKSLRAWRTYSARIAAT